MLKMNTEEYMLPIAHIVWRGHVFTLSKYF